MEKMERKTSTSPSNRHLGHYKSLLAANGTSKKDQNIASSEISEDEKTNLTHSLLLPLERSLVANWTKGNRRETGVALSHIFGSGEESSRLISELCQ